MGGFKKKLMIKVMKKAQPKINVKSTITSFRQRFQMNQQTEKKPLNINKTIHRYGPIIEAGIDTMYQKFQNRKKAKSFLSTTSEYVSSIIEQSTTIIPFDDDYSITESISNDRQSSLNNGISMKIIVGLILFIVILLGLIFLSIKYFRKKKNEEQDYEDEEEEEEENPPMNKSIPATLMTYDE